MTRLAWGAHGERFFETGTDRGVLYLTGAPGVPWNGLKAVNESPTGGEPRPYYLDGYKYLNVASAEEYAATLEAFSSPREFAVCDGTLGIHNGLFVTQQPRSQFGLSYRTLVGNDKDGDQHGYKIHLVYNALAAPSQRNNQTTGDGVNPLTLSWSITTQPPLLTGIKPTAHFVIDSRFTPRTLLATIEDILYGSIDGDPRMPSVQELSELFKSEGPLLAVNLFSNPSFELQNAASPTQELLRNAAINPLQASGGAGLTSNDGSKYLVTRGVALPFATPDGITTGAKITPTASATLSNGILGSAYNVDGLGNTAVARTEGAWVYANRAGYAASFSNSPYRPLAENAWTWVRGEPLAGLANSHCSIQISRTTGAGGAGGDVLLTDEVYITGSTCHLDSRIPTEAIWPGMPPIDPQVTAAWAGTANQSATILTGKKANKINNISDSWVRGFMSSEWASEGVSSIRVRPAGVAAINANSAIGMFVDLLPYVALGEEFTVMVKVRKTGPAVVNPGLYGAVDIYDGAYKAQATTPNVEGVHPVRFTFTRTTGTLQLRLVHGQPHNMAPDIFFDDLAIVIGDYRGPFFWGGMLDADGRFYDWQGLENDSPSEVHSWY
ncbi:major tail protein [Microbacterium phage Damascus]|nr:major tail protein [Microbacterium phage Damascus]